jgi:hypothetical protein
MSMLTFQKPDKITKQLNLKEPLNSSLWSPDLV